MKNLPNIITLSRIILSLSLLGTHTFSQSFFAIYTYCGVSDVLDGFLARKLNLSNEKGARLDSIADIIFYGVTAFKICPSLCGVLTSPIWCIIIAVALLRIISYIVAMIKYHQFASLHTYMNKLTGLLIFTVPYIIAQPFAISACMIISIVALLAALEELVIHISENQYSPDRKSLFAK